MTWADYDKALLALTIWREARGEGYTGMLAVAYSILNRVENPKWWGQTISGVIAKRWQYSSMTAPGDPQLIKFPYFPDISFEDAMLAAECAMQKSEANPVPGADSFYDQSISPPPWADTKKFVGRVGRILFYNLDNK